MVPGSPTSDIIWSKPRDDVGQHGPQLRPVGERRQDVGLLHGRHQRASAGRAAVVLVVVGVVAFVAGDATIDADDQVLGVVVVGQRGLRGDEAPVHRKLAQVIGHGGLTSCLVVGRRLRLDDAAVRHPFDVSRVIVEHRDRFARFAVEYVEAALAAQGRDLVVVGPAEVDDDLVRDMTEILTSFCARLYGKRASANRARRVVEVAVSPLCEDEL